LGHRADGRKAKQRSAARNEKRAGDAGAIDDQIDGSNTRIRQCGDGG